MHFYSLHHHHPKAIGTLDMPRDRNITYMLHGFKAEHWRQKKKEEN